MILGITIGSASSESDTSKSDEFIGSGDTGIPNVVDTTTVEDAPESSLEGRTQITYIWEDMPESQYDLCAAYFADWEVAYGSFPGITETTDKEYILFMNTHCESYDKYPPYSTGEVAPLNYVPELDLWWESFSDEAAPYCDAFFADPEGGYSDMSLTKTSLQEYKSFMNDNC